MRSKFLLGLRVSSPFLFMMMIMAFALCSSHASAQTFYGAVVGTVTDSSHAAVANATVTITNVGTNDKRTATTDSSGNYSFVSLVPATYKVEVGAGGFKNFLRSSIVVQVDTTVRVDAVMQVGAVTETVEVTTAPPMLQTESGSLGSEIEGKQVQEMPLNGRNTLNLMTLVPGVVPQGATSGSAAMNNGSGTSSAAWGNYQIGGGMPLQSSMYIDGAPIQVMNKNFTVLVPTQDTIQEFKVETSAVSPEFGRFGGGVVNMTSRSGSNSFHGSLYEYIRNRDLNANYFFSKRNGAGRPEYTQNQFGGTIGGPIWKNKAFFFFAYEAIHIRAGAPTLTNVPTSGMQNGIIPEVYSTQGVLLNSTVKDPKGICNITHQAGTAASPGTWTISNLYQGACGDSTAKIFKTFYATTPNNPTNATNNYFTTVSQGNDGYQTTLRLDYNLTSKQRIFARGTLWPLVDKAPVVLPSPSNFNTAGSQTHNHTNQIVAGDTITLTPTTLLDIRADYLRQYGDAIPPSGTNVDQAQFGPAYAALSPSMTYHSLPSFTFSGGTQLHNLFNFTYNNLTQTYYNNYHLSGGLTKIVGRHTLKMGAEGRLVQREDIGNDQAASGRFAFSNDLTVGDEWANFLMGYFDTGTLTTVKATTSFNFYQGYYLMDTWQAAPKLTLNLGLRWELPGAIGEAGNNATVLLPNAVDPYTGITGTVGLVASSLYPNRTTLVPYHNLFGPRFGFAYRLTDDTVVRGGYALSYLPPDQQIGAYANASPINTATTTNRNVGSTVTYTVSNPFPTGVIPATGRANTQFMTAFIGQVVTAPYPFEPYPHSQSMNVSIGHQFGRNLLFDIGYAHTLGTHLARSSDGRNQLPDQYDSLGPALAANKTPSGTPINLVYGGVTLPTALQTYGQTLRPFPAYSNYSNSTDFHGSSSYNALEVKLQERFKSAGQIGAAYTWMKMIGDADTILPGLELKSGGSGGNGQGLFQNYNNLKAERSIYSFSVPHRLVINYVLNLPFGQGQRFGANIGGVGGRVISGWSMNGITTFQSGFPLYLNTSGNNLSKNFGAGTIRPNYNPGNTGCNSTKTVDGSAYSRTLSGATWFNTKCFTLPGDSANPGIIGTSTSYAFGNEQRVDGTLKSSGIDNFDFSVVKSTTIHEQVALQLRVEFFNIFNLTQFAPPVTQTDSTQFGQVLNQANQPRLIQGALRLNF